MTPQLRFPEFTDDWHVKKLGELGKFTSGVGFTNSEQGGKHGTPFYKVSDMNLSGNTNEMTQANNYVSDTQVIDMKYKPIIDKSIIFAKVGAAIFLERKRVASNFLIDNNMMAFTPNGNLDFQYIKIVFDRLHLSKMAQVGALPSYNGSDLAIIKVQLPSHKEQEKIADFLTAVDERIAVGEKKLELLETYKRGVMQKIFSQQIRFKDENGNPYPDWEEKKLGEIARIYQPLTISQSDLTKTGYPVYGANGIIGKYDRFNHENEQIAVTCRGNTCGVINYTQPKSWITGNAMVINMDDSSKADKKFMYYQLLSQNLNYLITGSGQPQITGDIKQHKIFVPFIKEQQKIANFLTALDEKITAEKSKLTAVKQFKKALLQRMFV